MSSLQTDRERPLIPYKAFLPMAMVVIATMAACSEIRHTPTLAPTLAPTATETPTTAPVPTLTDTPKPQGTHSAIPTPTHAVTQTATPTRTRMPTWTPRPTLTRTPTRTPTPTATATPTIALDESKVVKIAELDEWSLATVYWSEDGQSVMYALARRVSPKEQLEMQWHRYEIATGATHPTGPAYTFDRQILEELEAERPGWVSPSGNRVIYARVSPDEPYTPTPHGFDLPPIEIWTARSDGTDAFKSYGPSPGCRVLRKVIWSTRETEVYFECSSEGWAQILLVTVDKNPVIHYVLFPGTYFGPTALSPDQTKLAYTDISGVLRIESLDSDKEWAIDLGFMPSWASDSRKLYYLKGSQDTYSLVGIYVADLDTGTDTELLMWSDYFPGKELTWGHFAVSPTGHMAVIELADLWLMKWSP